MTNSKVKTHLKLVILVLVAITIFACKEDPVEPIGPVDPEVVDIVWEPVGSLPSGNFISEIKFANNGNIWVSSWSTSEYKASLYLSTNNGDTWNKKYTYDNVVLFPMAVNPVNGYVFCSHNNTQGGFMRSTNNGESWETIIITDTSNIISLSVLGIIITASGEIYLGVQKIYANGEPWNVVGDYICYYSNDNGNTWVEKSKGLPDGLTPVAVGKDGTLYAGSNNGVLHSTDKGTTWLPSSNYNMYTHSLATCNDGSIFGIVPNVGIIVKSTDKGVNWNKVNTEFDTNHIYSVIDRMIYNPVTNDIFVNNNFNIYFGDYFDDLLENHYEIYRSSNLGKDWKLENEWGLPAGIDGPEGGNIFNFGVNSKTGQMFVAINNNVYRTKNYPFK